MIKTIQIDKFRIFKDTTLKLGSAVTVLAGENATGKSTLLGMLGNFAETKIKDGVPYIHNQFRAEFSELFRGSETFDLSGSNKYRITYELPDGTEAYRDHRVTWQTHSDTGKKRFRVLPYHTVGGKKNASHAKFPLPVLYLGLSRLFPLGEASDRNSPGEQHKFKLEDHKAWFVNSYNEVFSSNEDIQDVSKLRIKEIGKSSIGVSTKEYDYLCNSAGQDNLGQILLSILSFRRLKESKPDAYRGGLLLIDEFDATLHPSAQNKLLQLIIKQSKDLNLQVVITTHSLSLLKFICSKTEYNKVDDLNKIELHYFTRSNNTLELENNIKYQRIENDLLIKASIKQPKIKVYSEDSEARWFIEKILEGTNFVLELMDVNVGCHSLISLVNGDPFYFGNTIVIFDGDVTEADTNTIKPKNLNNYMKLPGQVSPEALFYEFLVTGEHSYFENEACKEVGFTYRYFKEGDPVEDEARRGEDRDRRKSWFNDHLEQFEATNLYDYWAKENFEAVQEFLSQLEICYNKVASRRSLPLYRKPS